MESKMGIPVDEIKKGIAPYAKEQKTLQRLIRLTKGLTAHRFDELFRKRKSTKAHPYSPDGFILGIGINGGTEWAWQLQLLRHMLSIGLVATIWNGKELTYITGRRYA